MSTKRKGRTTGQAPVVIKKRRICLSLPDTNEVKEGVPLDINHIYDAPLRALLRLYKGDGTHGDWETVVFRLYVGIVFCTYFEQEEDLKEIITDALHDLNFAIISYNAYQLGHIQLLSPQVGRINSAIKITDEMQRMFEITEDVNVTEIYKEVYKYIKKAVI